MQNIEQTDEKVTVHFADGQSEDFDLLIGLRNFIKNLTIH